MPDATTIQGIDLFSLYLSFKSYVNTYAFGWYRLQTDFQVAANDISNELWDEWTKKAGKSEEAADDLVLLQKTTKIMATKKKAFYAVAPIPSDYGRFASARIIDGSEGGTSADNCDNSSLVTDEQRANQYYDDITEGTIQLIDDQRWASCLQHKTKMPTLSKPKMNMGNQTFRIAPREVSGMVLSYYVKPEDAILSYTTTPGNILTGQGDQIIYNPPPKSTLLQWPNTVRGEFICRLGIRFGLFTRDNFMYQAANQQKQTA